MNPIEFLTYANRHPLARRARLRTYWNIFCWQLRSSVLKGSIQVPWIAGAVLMARKRMTGATGNIYYGLHEFEEMGFLIHLIRDGDLFVDVGANIGSYTILAASVRHADVIAFEPDPGTHQLLMDNINANSIASKVKVIGRAVGAEEGEITFSTGLDTMNHVVTTRSPSDSKGLRTVQVTTLDHELEGKQPVMMKIDVEGHEPSVIAGAAAVLANPSLLAVEIETVDAMVLKALTDAGFSQYSYDPFTRVCSPSSRRKSGHNSLFVRNIYAVQQRLKSSAPIRVLGQSL